MTTMEGALLILVALLAGTLASIARSAVSDNKAQREEPQKKQIEGARGILGGGEDRDEGDTEKPDADGSHRATGFERNQNIAQEVHQPALESIEKSLPRRSSPEA